MGQHDNIYLGSRPSMSTPRSSLTTPSLKKSHSMATTTEITRLDLSGLGPFTPELEATIRKAMEDPNRLSGRSLMELVRTIFNRVMENQAMAEPAARFCISIIEREKHSWNHSSTHVRSGSMSVVHSFAPLPVHQV